MRARNEGAPAGSRMEEKQVCAIAMMGNIRGGEGGKLGNQGSLRVNDRRVRESGTERSRSLAKFREMDAAKGYSNSKSPI